MSDENKTLLWESVENTDPAHMKDVKYPFPHKAIDAQYQILVATKLWGAFGVNWGVKNENFQAIPLNTKNECSVIYTATLFHPGGEFGINSDAFIYEKAKDTYKPNNDYAKKMSTDALTKGLSKLGFSADIFMGKYDGSKYDSINSYDVDFLVSESQVKTLKGLVEKLKTDAPDAAQFIDKQISGGMKSDAAEKLIKRGEEKLQELSK